MTFIPQNDFFLQVSRGLIPGHNSAVIRGNNSGLGTSTEDIWYQGGVKTYLSSAETMNMKSTSANDTSAGTGARTVLVEGLNGSYAVISETVTLNGVTNVLTSNSYLRITRVTVITAGSGELNAGTITATASTAATVQSAMEPGISISEGAHYTVPAAKTLFILKAEFNITKVGGGGDPLYQIQFQIRDGAISNPAWITVYEKEVNSAVDNYLDVTPAVFGANTEKTDIRVQAVSDRASTIARVRVYGVVIDD